MICVNIYLDEGSSLYNELLNKKVLVNGVFSIILGVKPNIGETLRLNNLNASDEKLIKFLSHKRTLYLKIDDIVQSYLITEGHNGIAVCDLKCTHIEKPF